MSASEESTTPQGQAWDSPRNLAAARQPRSPQAQPAYAELLHFFNESLDLLCIAGFDGYFKRLNSAWQPSMGWTVEQLQARPFVHFVHPDDRQATLAEVAALATGRLTVSFENRYRCKDGSYKWLQWTASPLPARQQIYAIAHDMTGQRRLERGILAATDREKERLGRELHDGLCQNLAGIAAIAMTLSRKLAARSRPESADAAEITRLINQTTKHARDLARGLTPVHLVGIGLAAALQGLALNVQALFHRTCKFRCNCPSLRLAEEVEVHLLRIAQEATHNAMTHGRAKRIGISLALSEGTVRLGIRDDGIGVRETAQKPTGIGLETMAYRARLIGGTLRVQRQAPRGTLVTCVFTLSAKNVERKPHGET
jgi:PAS domain S-box-containing protein